MSTWAEWFSEVDRPVDPPEACMPFPRLVGALSHPRFLVWGRQGSGKGTLVGALVTLGTREAVAQHFGVPDPSDHYLPLTWPAPDLPNDEQGWLERARHALGQVVACDAVDLRGVQGALDAADKTVTLCVSELSAAVPPWPSLQRPPGLSALVGLALKAQRTAWRLQFKIALDVTLRSRVIDDLPDLARLSGHQATLRWYEPELWALLADRAGRCSAAAASAIAELGDGGATAAGNGWREVLSPQLGPARFPLGRSAVPSDVARWLVPRCSTADGDLHPATFLRIVGETFRSAVAEGRPHPDTEQWRAAAESAGRRWFEELEKALPILGRAKRLEGVALPCKRSLAVEWMEEPAGGEEPFQHHGGDAAVGVAIESGVLRSLPGELLDVAAPFAWLAGSRPSATVATGDDQERALNEMDAAANVDVGAVAAEWLASSPDEATLTSRLLAVLDRIAQRIGPWPARSPIADAITEWSLRHGGGESGPALFGEHWPAVQIGFFRAFGHEPWDLRAVQWWAAVSTDDLDAIAARGGELGAHARWLSLKTRWTREPAVRDEATLRAELGDAWPYVAGRVRLWLALNNFEHAGAPLPSFKPGTRDWRDHARAGFFAALDERQAEAAARYREALVALPETVGPGPRWALNESAAEADVERYGPQVRVELRSTRAQAQPWVDEVNRAIESALAPLPPPRQQERRADSPSPLFASTEGFSVLHWLESHGGPLGRTAHLAEALANWLWLRGDADGLDLGTRYGSRLPEAWLRAWSREPDRPALPRTLVDRILRPGRLGHEWVVRAEMLVEVLDELQPDDVKNAKDWAGEAQQALSQRPEPGIKRPRDASIDEPGLPLASLRTRFMMLDGPHQALRFWQEGGAEVPSPELTWQQARAVALFRLPWRIWLELARVEPREIDEPLSEMLRSANAVWGHGGAFANLQAGKLLLDENRLAPSEWWEEFGLLRRAVEAIAVEQHGAGGVLAACAVSEEPAQTFREAFEERSADAVTRLLGLIERLDTVPAGWSRRLLEVSRKLSKNEAPRLFGPPVAVLAARLLRESLRADPDNREARQELFETFERHEGTVVDLPGSLRDRELGELWAKRLVRQVSSGHGDVFDPSGEARMRALGVLARLARAGERWPNGATEALEVRLARAYRQDELDLLAVVVGRLAESSPSALTDDEWQRLATGLTRLGQDPRAPVVAAAEWAARRVAAARPELSDVATLLERLAGDQRFGVLSQRDLDERATPPPPESAG